MSFINKLKLTRVYSQGRGSEAEQRLQRAPAWHGGRSPPGLAGGTVLCNGLLAQGELQQLKWSPHGAPLSTVVQEGGPRAWLLPPSSVCALTRG